MALIPRDRPGLLSRSGGPLGQKGYTLIEYAIAMAIFGTVVFTAVSVYKLMQRSYWQVDEKSQLERVLVYTMEQMSNEVRQAVSVNQLGSTPNAAATFQTVHLDATGNTILAIDLANVTPLIGSGVVYDANLIYFLRQMPDGTQKLFQRMMYYDNNYTQAFPAMAITDAYRLGKEVTLAPFLEPTPGGITPTPNLANTPTPVYNVNLGRMPGYYDVSRFNFDDVSFYYDPTNQIMAIGLMISIKSISLNWMPATLSRRRLTLTTSITMRNLGRQD